MKSQKRQLREEEVRNLGGHLVAKYYPDKRALVIKQHSYCTIIYFDSRGYFKTKNIKVEK